MSDARLPRTAIIIGAGIGGLGLANLLARSGVTVTVYDKLDKAGGRAGTFSTKGFTFDSGPSWYLMPEVFEHYFSLLGKRPEDFYTLTPLKPGYKVTFEDGSDVTIYADAQRDAKTFDAIEPGSAARLRRYLQTSKRTYDLAGKYFLYNNFDSVSSVLKREVLQAGVPLALAAKRTLHANAQRSFKSQKLQQILEYHSVFLGASPFQVPAIYSLMSHLDFQQGVYYPQGGIYKIVAALEQIGRAAGVKYRYKATVTKIIVRNGVATGVTLADGRTAHADIVISNADLAFTETKLLAKQHQTYPASYWQKRTAGPSALLMYLGVKGSLPEFEHHNLFFAEQWQENFEAIFTKKVWPKTASLYVCVPSKTDTTVAPRGHENVFVLVPAPAVGKTSAAELEKLANRYLDQLIAQSGVHDLRERIVVQRLFGPSEFTERFNAWQGTALGMAHTLKQSAMFRPKTKSRKVKNLFYVGGSTQPGIGIPMCLISAELVYKRLIGDTSAGPLEKIREA
jgi:1-hydroxy-2-isopentenylcarotenoid 3,4-desaturase